MGLSRRVGRRARWLLGSLALLVVAIVGVAVAFPSAAAAACPYCYGLVGLRDRQFVERGLSADERQQISAVLDDADNRVNQFYGDRKGSPRVLACLSADCYDRIGGGGERGIAILNRAVMLSPRGIDPVIASHELSHVELHRRLKSGTEPVPQWFDEGLAVVVSDDSRYLLPIGSRDRCRVVSDEALPVTLADWLRAATSDEQVYAKAACRVSRWLDGHGGPRGVLDLIDQLNDDQSFTTLVGS